MRALALTLAVLLAPILASAQDRRPELTVAVDNLWATMEPVLGISTTGGRVHPNFYDTLVERDFITDPNGLALTPRLATAWVQNGTVWTITLRAGVKFHDGTVMTADDVAFTLSAERLWGPRPIAPRGRTFTAGWKRVEAVGPLTVEIETEDPDPYLMRKLTGAIGFIVPKAYYQRVGHDRFGQQPIGTGAYRVTQFRSGELLRMEAFDDHWAGPPPARAVTWRIVPEFAGRLAGLVSGQFDMVVNIPTDQESVIRRYPTLTLVQKQAENYPLFAFNTLRDQGMADNPVADVRLRHAMIAGVNMHEIVQALWGIPRSTQSRSTSRSMGRSLTRTANRTWPTTPLAPANWCGRAAMMVARCSGTSHAAFSRTTRPLLKSWSSSGRTLASTSNCASSTALIWPTAGHSTC